MSSYGKRTATSPKENLSKRYDQTISPEPKVKVQAPKVQVPETKAQDPEPKIAMASPSYETDLDTLVKIELLTINGKPFLGQVLDDELLYIWVKVFNRDIEELFGVTSTKSLTRNVRGTYKLKKATKLSEIVDSGEFSYEKFLDDGQSEVVTGKILGFGALKAAEIGELTRVTVKTNFGVEADGVINWLRLYGIITSKYDFTASNNVGNTGIRSDVLQAEIVLKKHIPEYLPMYGQKVVVHYPGIPRMCNRCYTIGHMSRDCNNIKKDWIEYVNSLVEDGVNIEMVGSWKQAIQRWKNANANKRS
jgi:hypothetical protein